MPHDGAGDIQAISSSPRREHRSDVGGPLLEGANERRAVLRLDRDQARQPRVLRVVQTPRAQLVQGLPDAHEPRATTRGVEDGVWQLATGERCGDLEAQGLLAFEPSGLEEGRDVDVVAARELARELLAHASPGASNVGLAKAHL